MDFISKKRLSELQNDDNIIETFYNFAKREKEEKINQLIAEENLNEKAYRFIEKSISKGFVEYTGDELDGIIPPLSRRGGAREKKKEIVLEKLRKIVDVFVGI